MATGPDVIPLCHSERTIVLCFDGTGDQINDDNSNVVQLVSLLRKDNAEQLVYYQSGIGTDISSRSVVISSVFNTLDQMFAGSIDVHMMDGYLYLMQHLFSPPGLVQILRETKSAYLVNTFPLSRNSGNLIDHESPGFSRGAYTARSLVGMLFKVGLLPAGNFQQVPFAYKNYKKTGMVGWRQANEFKKACSVNVFIEFIGVWDTVASVGIFPKILPVNTASTLTRTFRHAISLDERRAKFQPNIWCFRQDSQLESSTAINGTAENIITDVEEVWFAGCHCDVGGGSVTNETRHSLARIPLRWMIRECFKANTGIMFYSNALRNIGLNPYTLYPCVLPRPPPLPVGSHRIRRPPQMPNTLAESEIPFLGMEEQEELHDALSPKYDQLKIKKLWWILEILPMSQLFQRVKDEGWVKFFGPHFGAPRFIPYEKFHGVRIHRSVKLRMEAEFEDERARQKGKKYVPKVRYDQPVWVD